MHLFPLRRLAALTALTLAACGGGGGGSATPAYDLTGHWQLFLTPAGSSDEVGPLPVCLAQSGSSFDGVDVTGTMSGTSVTLNANGGLFLISLTGSATSADAAAGNATFSGGVSGNGAFRLARYQPAGTMDASGSLDGNSISKTSVVATGMRKYSDPGLTTLTSVTVVLDDAGIDLEIALSPAGLAVGALAVPGTVSAEILLRIDSAIVSATASGGTVTVTRYDGTGIAGSYSLTTSVGTITGAFDVSFDIEAYDP